MQLLFLFMVLIILLNPVMAGMFLVTFILLLPVVLLFHSFQILVMVPASLWQTFTNAQVRKNHALEHATANVLEEKYGVKWVAGMAFKNGFKLYGQLPDPVMLIEAAQEGLARLQHGEKHLALHPRCGTALIIGQFLFALLFVIMFFFMEYFSLTGILFVFAMAILLHKPLGMLTQKYLTTSTDVEDMHINNVSVDLWGQFYFETSTSPVQRMHQSYQPMWFGFRKRM